MTRQITNIFVIAVLLLCATVALADRHVVELWSVTDVAEWVNKTVGYPEYAHYFEQHLVDGPTLLNLEVEDLEDTIPMTNRIHIAKFKGHLSVVKDQCLCKLESSSSDFWSHLRNHQVRTWILGSAAIFAPRAAIIGTFLFDYALYEEMTSTTVEGEYPNGLGADGKPLSFTRTGRISQESSWLFTIAYWVIGMLFPSGYLFLNFLPFIGTNFLVVPILSINFIVEQHREVFLFMSFLYGDFKERTVKEKLMAMFPLPTLFPLIAVVLSFIAPLALLQLFVVALMIFSLFIGVGFVMMLFSAGEGAQDEAAARAEAEARAAAAAAGGSKHNSNASSSRSAPAYGSGPDMHSKVD